MQQLHPLRPFASHCQVWHANSNTASETAHAGPCARTASGNEKGFGNGLRRHSSESLCTSFVTGRRSEHGLSCNFACRAILRVEQFCVLSTSTCRAVLRVGNFACRAVLRVEQLCVSSSYACQAILRVEHFCVSSSFACRAVLRVEQFCVSSSFACRTLLRVEHFSVSSTSPCRALLRQGRCT